MTASLEERVATARAAIAQLIADVENEGHRGTFWLLRLRDIKDRLAPINVPADQVMADAIEIERLLYAAPRDNFTDFYLMNVDPQRRTEENRRFLATAQTLHDALHG